MTLSWVARALVRLPVWAVVALGGAVGTALRLLLVDLTTPERGWSPGVALANVTGALALGVVAAYPFHDRHVHHTRAFFGTGVLGAYTTFSAISLALVDGSPRVDASLTLATSLVGGLAGAWVGLRFARSGLRTPPHDPREDEEDL